MLYLSITLALKLTLSTWMVLISLSSSVPCPTGKCKDGHAALSATLKPGSWDARACIHSAPTTVIPSLFRAPYFRILVHLERQSCYRWKGGTLCGTTWSSVSFYVFDPCQSGENLQLKHREASIWVFTEYRAISYSCQARVY